MDFMRILDQTVREIKREVNLKVLKVPEIEQKVLDATNDEPWGPHGTVLSEIAQATKKFPECQLILNVLWTRLTDTGPNWRHVYKALNVIEYLVSNGSERALDDILVHISQISAISGFEYVDPNGKDLGINVRMKVETLLTLLLNKEKIQAAREKAVATRNKYFGLSSAGITSKSSSASCLSGPKGDNYTTYGYKVGDQYGKECKWKHENKDSQKSQDVARENAVRKLKRNQDSLPSNSSKILTKPGAIPSSKSHNAQANSEEDDFDDFDPRRSSSASKSHNAQANSEEDDFDNFDPRRSSNGSGNARNKQVDLFEQSLVGDLMDDAPPISTKTTANESTVNPEIDLFADAASRSASCGEATQNSLRQGNMDLFATQPAFPPLSPSNVDLMAVPKAVSHSETKSNVDLIAENFDPFAAIPVSNFEKSDPFASFASHAEPVTTKSSQNTTNTSCNDLDIDSIFGAFTSTTEQAISEPSHHSSQRSLDNLKTNSMPEFSKENFQVKSGVWADCLNRGLIDLNISAPKRVNLSDIGIMGELHEVPPIEKEKWPTVIMGRAMGAGSGLGRSGFSTATGGSGNLSNSGQQHY
ncbi:clathrin interactor EPSIN 1 [Canna indica]|uniref:Clathrin interactor EPSIN 1 n=1 Tax=Canna indica TaxID=4628 RepID=A0AAQ3Q459_9LILI|nr:clathrin interactor EPSIN 1 [Canna indica]